MSQSDYLKYKKTGTLLRINNTSPAIEEFPSVFPTQDYISYKDYNLENNITNTKITYNQLRPPNKQIVFGMEKSNVSNCPAFLLCNGTNSRPNRANLRQYQITPRPVRKYVKDPTNPNTDCKLKCKCKNTSCVCTVVESCSTKKTYSSTDCSL